MKYAFFALVSCMILTGSAHAAGGALASIRTIAETSEYAATASHAEVVRTG